MERKHLFPALMQFLAVGCAVTMAAVMLTEHTGRSGLLPLPSMVMLSLWPAVELGLAWALFQKPRSLKAAAALGVLCALVCCAVVLPPLWGQWALGLFMAAVQLCLALFAFSAALQPLQTRSLVVCLDSCTLLAAAYGAYLFGGAERSLLWFLPGAAALAAAVLALVCHRMDRPLGLREGCFLAVVFALVGGAVWLLHFAAAGAGAGVVGLWGLALSLGRWLLRLLTAAMGLLAALFPPAQGGAAPLPPELSAMTPTSEEVQEDPVLAGALVLVVLALAVVLGVVILRRWGRLRLGGQTAGEGVTLRRQKSPWAMALRRSLERVRAWLRVRRFLRRHRDEPVGLYAALVQTVRPTPWHKERSETVREFLTRLKGLSPEDEALATALSSLVPQVERALYGQSPAQEAFPDAAALRRRVRAALRAQRIRRQRQRLRLAMARWSEQ